MGCIYSDFDGKCTMFWNEDEEQLKFHSTGINDEGDCTCEEDPDPTIFCEHYEEN